LASVSVSVSRVWPRSWVSVCRWFGLVYHDCDDDETDLTGDHAESGQAYGFEENAHCAVKDRTTVVAIAMPQRFTREKTPVLNLV